MILCSLNFQIRERLVYGFFFAGLYFMGGTFHLGGAPQFLN